MSIFIDNYQTRLVDHLKRLLDTAEEAHFAVAFVRQSGVNLLRTKIEAMIARGGVVNVTFANDFGATEASAVEMLRDIGVNLRYYHGPASFHPKAYVFKIGGAISAVIGSSNVSASGLSTGTEWNVLLGQDDMDCSEILSEFRRLWNSQHTSPVSDHIIADLKKRIHSEVVAQSLQQQDYESDTTRGYELLDQDRNYVVRSTANADPIRPSWNFQIYENKLQKYASRGDFHVVVVCDSNTPQERVFDIPYSYLQQNIFPFASRDDKGRYLFEIRKKTLKFNWRHKVPMEGDMFCR